jgi:hypothetical protein
VDFLFLGAVRGDPARVDSRRLQFGGGLLQVTGLARGQHDPRPGFAQGMGHLQPQASRTTGHECRLAFEIE